MYARNQCFLDVLAMKPFSDSASQNSIISRKSAVFTNVVDLARVPLQWHFNGIDAFVKFIFFAGLFSCSEAKKHDVGIDLAENRGMVTCERNLWSQVFLVNSRAMISKIDVIRGFWGTINFFLMFKVLFLHI